MKIVDDFNDWLESIGVGGEGPESIEKGIEDSEEWVRLHFDDPQEYAVLCQMIQAAAMETVMAEGNILGLPMAIFNYTFRFATHLEAEKNMPKI